jgi:heme/copper-type cytochrome/quinol oxidase subunit 3
MPGNSTALRRGRAPHTAGRIGLTVFLLVISSLFGLFMVSYQPQPVPDWEVLSEPAILWFNTVLGWPRVALQRASNAAKTQQRSTMRQSVLAARC